MISYEKSFASHPKSKYWDYSKNIEKPEELSKASNKKKYWFICETCKHSFDVTLNNVNTGYWCSFCSNKKLCKDDNCQLCYNKSFASHPRSKYWDYSKNTGTSRDYFKSANKEIYFICENCNHSFSSSLNHISNRNSWCPYCSEPTKRLCDDNSCKSCFEKSFSSHPKSKCLDISKNNINTRTILRGSNNRYWFVCDTCHHSFETRPHTVISGFWCPYCGNEKLCQDNNCQLCYNKSFASNVKSKCWDYSKNTGNPRDYFKNTRGKFYFICEKCNHSFITDLGHITQKDSWCQYCCNKKLCDDKNCKSCFETSFASHPISSLWSKDNVKSPREVFKNMRDEFWFECKDCSHKFKSSLQNIMKWNSCSYCRRRSMCDNLSCKWCFETSFSSHPKSKYWDTSKNETSPIRIFKGTHTKYWFICENNHSFQVALHNCTCHNRWCPYCLWKNQEECRVIFEKMFKKRFVKQVFNRKDISIFYELDGYNKDLELAFEYDGEQHYTKLDMFHRTDDALLKQQIRDKLKDFYCKLQGIKLIRIPFFVENKRQFIENELFRMKLKK